MVSTCFIAALLLLGANVMAEEVLVRRPPLLGPLGIDMKPFVGYNYTFDVEVDGFGFVVDIGLEHDQLVIDSTKKVCDALQNVDACASLVTTVQERVFEAKDKVAASTYVQVRELIASADPEVQSVGIDLAGQILSYTRSVPWGRRYDERVFFEQRERQFVHTAKSLASIWRRRKNGLFPQFVLPSKQKLSVGQDEHWEKLDQGTPFLTHISKLEHDIEQLSHLINIGALPASTFWPIVGDFIAVLQNRRALAPPNFAGIHDYFFLTEEQFGRIGRFYNTFIYAPVAPPQLPYALNPNLKWEEIERQYLGMEPEIIYIDDFLHPDALQALVDFCNEATIFYDVRIGYLGAYMREGLDSPVLRAVAAELRQKLPNIIGDLPLKSAWAYKYDSEQKGIKIHADQALINVNFWITPNVANLDPDSGGLIIYHREPPPEWSFADYNNFESEGRNEEYVSEGLWRRKKTVVPYRQNRAVIFNSKLFHKTDHHTFKKGLLNRRINLTFLFGACKNERIPTAQEQEAKERNLWGSGAAEL